MTHTAMPPDTSARAWVDVNLDAVLANGRRVMEVAGARLLPMVKANGYGLGAVRVAQALESLNPWGFGVATVEEGAELRSAGIGRPIVVFTPLIAGWVDGMLRSELRPVVGDPGALRRWLGHAPGRPFHVGIDTGMARAGVPWNDEPSLTAMRQLLASAAGYEGVCTHFHSADTDRGSIVEQRARFEHAIAALGRRPELVHAANSAAALASRSAAGELVRPGIFLYGGQAGNVVPEPVAAFRGLVVAVREVAAGSSVSYGATWRPDGSARVATLGVGYADGLPRSLSNRGLVELAGARLPIRGRVTMDMTLVEVPAGVRVGDVATVFGGLVSLDEQAQLAGTISYELLTSLGARVPRRYGAAA